MSVDSLREIIIKIQPTKGARVDMQRLLDQLIQAVRKEEQEALPKCSSCNTSLDFRFNWRYSNRKNIWWCESCMDKD